VVLFRESGVSIAVLEWLSRALKTIYFQKVTVINNGVTSGYYIS